MADRVPAYVQTWFKELDFLKVSQRDVARHFGVSEQMVSRWARGVAPMSPQRWDEFLAFVRAKEQEALERAKTEPRRQGSTVLTGAARTPEELLQARFDQSWPQWVDEVEERGGGLYDDLVRQLQILRPYMSMDGDKLRELLNSPPTARQARTAIVSAAKTLAREMSRLERMKPLGGTQA
jgi:transcriptional regulator with XRE-family HTH domain